MMEWGFWASAGGITFAVMVLFLRALRRAPQRQAEADADLKVYRDQLAEVDRDLARGVISPADAERVKTEVSRRLLDADRSLRLAAPRGGAGSTAPAAVLVFLLLAAGLAGYVWLGAPGYPDLPMKTRLAMADQAYRDRPSQAAAEAAAPLAPAPQADAAFLDLMARLRAAVAAKPDDQEGLALLARNEASLGDFIAARKAQEHLVALKGDKAGLDDHLALAQTMIAATGGYVSPEAERELIRTLELDPRNGLARYYSGLMFAQVGRTDRTFELWRPLLDEGPADAPWMEPIRQSIEDVAARAGIKYSPPATGKGPDANAMAAAAEMSAEDRQAMIEGMVGQLETRLNGAGGPVEDWAKLITSLGVLGQPDRAKAALTKAEAVFAGQEVALSTLRAAAETAGVAP